MTNIQGGRPRRPAEVDRSLLFWWIAIGGQVLSDILQVTLLGTGNSITGLLGQAASGVSGFGIAVQVITLIIWAALVHNTGQGSNSARWVLTVLAGIEELVLLVLAIRYFTQPNLGAIVLGVVSLGVFVCALLAIIAMHQPAARIHFQRLT
jgi:hypothetical protein